MEDLEKSHTQPVPKQALKGNEEDPNHSPMLSAIGASNSNVPKPSNSSQRDSFASIHGERLQKETMYYISCKLFCQACLLDIWDWQPYREFRHCFGVKRMIFPLPGG
jgi:hypothetical protein